MFVTDFVQYWFPLAVSRNSLAVEVSHLPPFRSEDELDCRFVYAPLCDCSAASVHDCADVLHGVVGATCLEKNGRKGTESKAAQILLAVQVPVSEAGTIFRRRSPAATGRFSMNAVNIQIVTANLQDFNVSNEDNIVPVGFTLPCR